MPKKQNDPEPRLERLRAACRARGIKLTPQRLEVFRAVVASDEHPTAEAVCRAVRRLLPTVSLDTVYRTLATLRELGLIAALGPRHESVRFDGNLARHHHFTCVRCGAIRDFTSEELDALALPPAAAAFGEVLESHVEVRGVCGRCAGARRAEPGRVNSRKPRGEERGNR